MGTVTTVGRTLDRNLSSVDEILQNGNNLFQGAKRAYDPNYNWLDLNLATAPGVTGAYIAGLLRDRLAGICRRIVANHSSGLSAAVLATLGPVRRPVVGLLRPAAQRHPDHPQHPERRERLRHRPVPAAAGPHPDRQRRAGCQSGAVDAARGRAVAEEHAAGAHHHDHDDAGADHDDDDQPCGLLGVVLGCSGSSGTSSGSGPARAGRARAPRARARWAVVEPGHPRFEASPPRRWRRPRRQRPRPRPTDADRARGRPAAPAAAGPGQGHVRHRQPRRGLLSGWVHDVEGWF